ncbi:efflux RND transporter periplasmic adaptor subunit [Geothrix sp. PMB-07]|uniref:efflux RND transporter periplasmic adaptor subunit n=1 Tax=Geothrix sp. PMB-07 TaxID=3068640 RepID=UPI00274268D0|nr:efflux RND transporter periplasmic adaptor subunit [Geothrix sp. PMB-07]WLT30985.1 efflux RND transporter periplasmic adaptor subunit [Geothrix sp. PMB-07]
MNLRTALTYAVPTLVLTGAALLWSRPTPKAPPSSDAAIRRPRQIRCEGRVTTYPGADIILAPEYGGRLDTLAVQELDRVKPGQLLAQLDAREQTAALTAARAHIAELEAELRFLALEQTRQARLLKEGAVGQRAFDDSDSRLKLTLARVEAARAQVAQQEALLSKLTVRAPFGGTVVERMAHAGELLPAGAKLLRLADLDRIRVEAEVDEYDLSRLQVGSPVTVEAEGLTGTWAGKVEEIPEAVTQRRLKALDPSRPTDIRVAIVKVALAGHTPLKLGQRVELSIQAH